MAVYIVGVLVPVVRLSNLSTAALEHCNSQHRGAELPVVTRAAQALFLMFRCLFNLRIGKVLLGEKLNG